MGLLSGLTVECLFNADTAGAYTQMGGFNDSWNFGIGDTSSRLRFTTAAVQDYIFSSAGISTGVTYHMAIVFDSAFDAHLYLDGAFVQTVTGGSAGNVPGGEGWWVVRSELDHFDGRLDEMAVYATELSAARILAHYDAALAVGTTHTKTGWGALIHPMTRSFRRCAR